MSGGFKEYAWECAAEIPNAFRRGVVVVTLLANLILAIGLHLGWQNSPFTTLQIWTAAVAVSALEIILILPYRLWKTSRSTIDELKKQLAVHQEDRPLAYQNVRFVTRVNKRTKTCDITATVHFANFGERMLKWRLRSYSIEANGIKLSAAAATTDYFMNRGQQGWYTYPTLQNVPFNGWPVQVDVMFDCEYDNAPPLRVRGTKRLNRYIIPALKAQNIPAFDLISEER
ncbi:MULTISPECIES: hypothetical protein [unclassified Bradyrhizobium]